MKLPRRQFLHLAAGAAALPAGSRIGRTQDYPARSVRIIVGFTAGSATDITARLFAQKLNELLKDTSASKPPMLSLKVQRTAPLLQ